MPYEGFKYNTFHVPNFNKKRKVKAFDSLLKDAASCDATQRNLVDVYLSCRETARNCNGTLLPDYTVSRPRRL